MNSPSPSRPAYFAQKFIRLLTKTAAAQDLGPNVCWLLSVIACQEDAKRYMEPARFYYEQLMPLCGFRSRKQLRAAIEKAEQHGWLQYVAGGKGIPGRFSVMIPNWLEDLPTTNCDETFSSDSELKAELQRERKRNCKGNTSIPTPNPSPNTSSTKVDGVCDERKRKNNRREYSPQFLEWWEHYPRKVAKPPASKAFISAISRIRSEHRLDPGAALQWLIERTQSFTATSSETPIDKIPHPATWLNADRFNDAESLLGGVSSDPYADLEYIQAGAAR